MSKYYMHNLINRVRDKFFAMVDSGMKNWDDRESRDILRSILMTTCDVAAITKPWEIQRKVRHVPRTRRELYHIASCFCLKC